MTLFLNEFICFGSFISIITSIVKNNISLLVISIMFFIITLINSIVLIRKDKIIAYYENNYFFFIKKINNFYKNNDNEKIEELLDIVTHDQWYLNKNIEKSDFPHSENLKNMFRNK